MSDSLLTSQGGTAFAALGSPLTARWFSGGTDRQPRNHNSAGRILDGRLARSFRQDKLK